MKTECVQIRLEPATKAKLKRLAYRKRMTMSEIIRAWVEAA